MRIFVYEYICGGGLAGQPLPESLHREGWAMLRAVLEDFRRCPGVETVTLLDARLAQAGEQLAETQIEVVQAGAEARLFREQTQDADFTLVIAPEFDFLLFQRCCWVEEADGCLLGPTSAAVHLTGDKLRLGQFWHRRGVPTPRTRTLSEVTSAKLFPLVCKPRHGAGSQGIFSAQNMRELLEWSSRNRSGAIRDEWIMQRLISGHPVSVSVVTGLNSRLVLPASMQELSAGGGFRYLGGHLPLPDDLNDRAQQLALRAIAPIDGLSGYAGVDLILGDAVDGSQDFAIEINPRLTTSYVGLRRLANFNLAETMLLMALRKPLPKRTYREGIVRFQADGTVSGPEIQ